MAKEQELIKDIELVAKKLGVNRLSRSLYLTHGQFSGNQIYDFGRDWTSLCSQAGLLTAKNNDAITDAEYFKRLRHAVRTLGRFPKTTERKEFQLNISKSRYATLGDFIRRAVELGEVEDIEGKFTENETSSMKQQQGECPHAAAEKQCDSVVRIAPPIPLSGRNREKWKRIGVDGFPYAPHDESGVVALFAILCALNRIGWQIIELNGGKGIDCVCWDDKEQREIRVELKYQLKRESWNHSYDDIDYLVCWENRWKDFPKPVIELKELVLSLARKSA